MVEEEPEEREAPRKGQRVRTEEDDPVEGGDLGVDGLAVSFLQAGGARLNPEAAYRSDRVGGQGGKGPVVVGGDGTPVVGVFGKTDNGEETGRPALNGIGLVVAP